MLDAVLARCVEGCPVAVLARLSLQRALSAEWVDAVFAAHAEQQYTRELLFSTVVDLMALVAVGLRPSLHAAAREAMADGTLRVSRQALYAKVQHTEPAVVRALVGESAARLAPVAAALRAGAAGPGAVAWLPGYRVRVLDGNHLPPSARRAKVLRAMRGAPLPGQAVVLYAPEQDLVVDLVAGEDAYAPEQGLAAPLLAQAAPGEVWLADRHYATRALLHALHARGAAVLVREPTAQPRPTPAGPREAAGRSATGRVYEQPVDCPAPAGSAAPALRLRRIEVELDAPLESGETVLRLLTTLPAAVDAPTVAALYRRRWSVEGLCQRLEAVLHSEVRTLGHPRAALWAFGVAVVAYNGLAVVQTVLEGQAARAAVPAVAPSTPGARDTASPSPPVPVSLYHVAHTVREHYRGMLLAVPAAAWAAYDGLTPEALAAQVRGIATHVRLEAFRKHPRKAGGPRARKAYVARADLQHVSTARLLVAAQQRRGQQAP